MPRDASTLPACPLRPGFEGIPRSPHNASLDRDRNGGEGGIRTHGPVARSTVFETAPFDRSGTSPGWTTAQGGGEGGIRTHGRVSPTHAFQACSLSHSDTSPGCWQRTPAPSQGLTGRPGDRKDAKKPRNSAALSSARTPELHCTRWLSRGSCTRFPREPQNPAFGSAAPYTNRSILLATRAPAHMGHGSRVTYMLHPARRQPRTRRAASRSASSSA